MAKSKFAEDADVADVMDSTIPDEGSIEADTRSSWNDKIVLPGGALGEPYMTLTQGNAKIDPAEAPPGEWYVEAFGSVKNPIIVPLKFGMSRRYSRNDEKGNPITACYAPTNANWEELHGIAKTPDGPGILCSDCKLADWSPKLDSNGNHMRDENNKPINNPPLCKEAYDYVCWSVDHGIPVKVSFKSSGIKVGKLLAQLGVAKGLGNFAVRLGSERRTEPFVFLAPTVAILRGSEAEDAVSMAQALYLPG
jgi:hypothetical protein